MDQYYTIREIAELFKVTPQCVAGWVKKEWLAAEKLGGNVRISKEQFDKFRKIHNKFNFKKEN